jgi:AAA domain
MTTPANNLPPAMPVSFWRNQVCSKDQLPKDPPRYHIAGLVPAHALTYIVAPSYNCKTWFALAAAKAISTGQPLWCFEGPREPVPVIYHVPEMHGALVRQYADKIGIDNSDMFLFRTMEHDVWPLDDMRMLSSSRGRVVVLDTSGYFNPGAEVNDYKQSLEFAKLIYKLLNCGCLGVVGLYHPPKYSAQSKRTVWTLENSVLGSAGYGGILRSCLRMKNLNSDLNDPNVWVYVEGLKNPGLKPFQLDGLPLRMKVEPGQSLHLNDLVQPKSKGSSTDDARYPIAAALFEQGMSQRKVRVELNPRPALATVNSWHKRWVDENSQPVF